MLLSFANKLDSLGFRSTVAFVANLAYPDQSFSVDADGHWVNKQSQGTIVSPVIHTTPYARFGEWVMHHWTYCYTPKADDIVVDLGSGIGEEALIFSKLIGGGLMLAVEAHPETFACLQKTLARSGVTNVRPIHCAVGNRDGEANIDTSDAHLANSIMTSGGTKVPQLTLDTLARDLPKIDFLRMNIEGAEKLVIEGMNDSVQRVMNVCISCHDFIAERGGAETFRSKAKVISFLEQTGFSVTIRPPEPGMPWVGDYVYGAR